MNGFNEHDPLAFDLPSVVTNVMPATTSPAVYSEPANDEGFVQTA